MNAGAALRRRALALRNRGDAVECPLCERRFARFAGARNRPGAICWRCGSHERHRALWLYFERHPELLAGADALLHFAPEYCLERQLALQPRRRYVTADLDPAVAMLRIDITDIALGDRTFDAILCSHVLEHVDDDRAAMRELHRVLRPGGWAIVMTPIDHARAETYEDPAITTPQARLAAFLQEDHVRLYAPDIAERLAQAGFDVTRERWVPSLRPEEVARYGLLAADDIYVCRRPTGIGPDARL